MLKIKLIYKSLLDNHIRLMGQISAVILLFFYFIISIYIIVTFSPKTPGNVSFIESLNSLGVYLYVIFFLLSILVVYYRDTRKEQNFKNFLSNKQMVIVKYFPVFPIFISSIGFAVGFISALLKNLLFVQIGINMFLIGLLLGLIMFLIKNNIESQISYSITEAQKSLNTIDKNNSYKVKKFTKYIKLTLNNLNLT